MKILVLGLTDPYFAPMLCGFLNYYLPEDAMVYSKEEHRKPDPLAIKLMDSVGIDIDRQLTTSLTEDASKNLDLVITSSTEAKRLYEESHNWDDVEVYHFKEDLDHTLNDKEFKKSLKQIRKRLQKYCENLLEEVN